MAEVLARKLERLESDLGGYEEFVCKAGVSQGTRYSLRYARGNPTLKMVESIARNLRIEPFEMFGFTPEEVRNAFTRVGLNYDALKRDIARRNGRRGEATKK